jgi:hypothetical protein
MSWLRNSKISISGVRHKLSQIVHRAVTNLKCVVDNVAFRFARLAIGIPGSCWRERNERGINRGRVNMNHCQKLSLTIFAAAAFISSASFAGSSKNGYQLDEVIGTVTSDMPRFLTCPDGSRIPVNQTCPDTLGDIVSEMPKIVECSGGIRVPAGDACPQKPDTDKDKPKANNPGAGNGPSRGPGKRNTK